MSSSVFIYESKLVFQFVDENWIGMANVSGGSTRMDVQNFRKDNVTQMA